MSRLSEDMILQQHMQHQKHLGDRLSSNSMQAVGSDHPPCAEHDFFSLSTLCTAYMETK